MDIGKNIELLTLIWIIGILSIAVSLPANWRKKTDLERRKKQAAIEEQYYLHYKNNVALYESWPELKEDKTLTTCREYLRKLFPRKNLFYITPSITRILLYYKEIKPSNMKTFKIAALKCEPAVPVEHRKNFYFIRTPKLDCMYIMGCRTAHSKEYHIATEICEFHTYKFLKQSGGLQKAIFFRQSNRQSRDNDDLKKQEEHERIHLKDYLSNDVAYKMWSNLELLDKTKFCLVFLKKLYPRTQFLQTYPAMEILDLHYTKTEKNTCKQLNILGLCCHTPERAYHTYVMKFIRAPPFYTHNCVYVVKQISIRKGKGYQITKRLCEGEVNDYELSKLE